MGSHTFSYPKVVPTHGAPTPHPAGDAHPASGRPPAAEASPPAKP